eukprot:gene10182-18855_t
MGTSEILNDLAGYLLVKHHYKGESNYKYLDVGVDMCVFDESSKQLQLFKSSKDAFVKMPSGILDLHGAHFYYENAELFNFVINISGKEHHFKADNHDVMMDWLRGLREKVYPEKDIQTTLLEKRTKSLDFNTIDDDEALFQKPVQLSMSLSDLNESPRRRHRRKRRVFLPWSFRWSSNSSSNVRDKEDVDISANENKIPNSQSSGDFSSNSFSVPSARDSSASTKKEKVYPDKDIQTTLLEKRTKSLDFNTIDDDEALFQKPVQLSMSLSDLNESPRRRHRRKRRVFLPWSFRWSSNSSSNVRDKEDVDISANENKIPNSQSSGDFSSNSFSVPSARDSSASTKKWKCKSCAALSSNNECLGDEVEKLTERIRALEETAAKSEILIQTLKIENLALKKDLVIVTQEIVTQEEETDANLEYNRGVDLEIKWKEFMETASDTDWDYNKELMKLVLDGVPSGRRPELWKRIDGCAVENVFKYCHIVKGKEQAKFHACSVLHCFDKCLRSKTCAAFMYKTDHRTPNEEKLRECTMFSGSIDIVKHFICNESLEYYSWGKDYYKELCRLVPSIEDTENEFDDSIEKQIRIDLLRTMPSHVDFKTLESEGIEKLFRVLRAFLLHNPEIGYCQGMNFMVAMGLLNLSEEDAFWLLVAITEVYFNKKHYNHYLTGSQADQKVLEDLAAKRLPNIMQFTKENGCDISPVTFNWLMTLFIDSVPPEVAQRIWDCFFVEGHTVLYRFSLALLKLNEGGICAKTDMLAQMRYLKKIGRQIHDVEALSQLAYEGFEPFPSSEVLVKMYEKHFSVIQEAHEQREKQDKEYERKRHHMRTQPKAININLGEALDNIPQDFMIECSATEANANKVWLCCSTHNVGKLFVLDTVDRSLDAIKGDIKSRCLCLTRSKFSNTMIVGTADASLHGFDIETRKEIWSLPVDDSVSSISCDESGVIFSTLASGSIAVAQQDGEVAQPSKPVYMHIGSAPVVCGCICGSYFWCGCGNNIVILDINTLDEVESIQVCPNLRHSIAKLIDSDIGVWCSVRGSSVLQLFDKKTFMCIMTTDVMDESGLASEKHENHCGFTAEKRGLGWTWQRTIFDIRGEKGPKPLAESSDGPISDLVETKLVEDFEEDEARERAISQPMAIAEAAPPCCHVTLVKKSINSASSFSLGDSGFVFVSRLSGSSDQLDACDKFHIVLKQLQRVSEDAVRCLVCVRNDYKQILSCVGAINDEMSTVLWSCERRQGKEMWYAQTVTYGSAKESEYTSLKKLKS